MKKENTHFKEITHFHENGGLGHPRANTLFGNSELPEAIAKAQGVLLQKPVAQT